MTTCVISCIVEGHGEIEALPVLVRRVAGEIDPELVVHVPRPLRVPKDKLIASNELEQYVRVAAREVSGPGGVLVLIDADDDCPGVAGPELLRRAQDVITAGVVAVVVAKREYEGWFLAGAPSLSGRRGLFTSLETPHRPEEVRGAKEWLRDHMEGSRTYSEVVDQPALTAALDLDLTRQSSDSFDKCWREIERLLRMG